MAQADRVVPTPAELAPRIAPTPGDAASLPPRPVPRELAKPQDEVLLDVVAYEVAPDAPPELRAALPALTAAYVGRARSYEDLVNATTEVTRFLQRELGYYLGYAYLPAQAPEGGVVRIAVLEGRLDRVELRWDDRVPVRREVVEAYLSHLKPGDILRVRNVERVVFLVNDLRGMNARFDVAAGSRPGTAMLVVTPQAEARWSGKVDVDLNGSRFLGTERIGAVALYASPFGRGDGFTATALSSFGNGLRFALLGYVSPVGSSGLKLGATVSTVDYALDSATFDLGLNGSALNVTAYGLYPWVRSRNLNLFGLASLEYKRYVDRQDVTASVTRKTVHSLTAGITGDFRDAWLSGAVNAYELNVSAGSVRYEGGRSSQLDDDADHVKLMFSINRLQNLVDNRLLLYLALRGQLTGHRLDTTEQFRLGGPDAVRAFAAGEATGDRGAVMTAELRLLPPESWLGPLARELVFGLFYDAGRRGLRPGADGGESRSFSGAGVSVSWERPRQWALRASLATPLAGDPRGDPRERDPRLYLQLTRVF
ncbi:ShlB/FhaC/HecB family hemolysin secretion/activation protein [Aquincola sp. MAHUQ-54]|uniref:ShlB/FhaC/HecB family hemolysin secretion/activation protein n=1 Tax=Aquincola agrisoli TaxID=3119538 RepID=A0AAW9QGH6_9BURK